MNDARTQAARIEGATANIAEALAQSLRRASYSGELLGTAERIAPRLFDAIRLPLVLDFLRGLEGSAAVATRLFAYGDAVALEALDPWLEPSLRIQLQELGWLVPTPDGVRSRLRLLAYDQMWLAADELDAPDPVMPPGATTHELTRALPTELQGTVLDVGCGCGALALGAARRGAQALGLDIDPCAVAWSRFNAALNGLQARFEESDLFSALGDETFDLVIAQPPFVPQPSSGDHTTYLHGGARGDELTFRMLREIGCRIGKGGRGLVLFDTPDEATPLWKRTREALADDDLDVVVVASPGHTADLAAVGYAAAGHPTLAEDYAETAIRYRQHLRKLDISRFLHTLLVLSRRPEPGARATVTLTPQSLGAYDYEGLIALERGLVAASLPREQLADRMVVAAPGSVLVQKDALDHSQGLDIELHFRHGRGENQALSDAAAVLMRLAAQPQTVDGLMRAFADAADAEPEEVQSSVFSFVRDGLVRGMLVEP